MYNKDYPQIAICILRPLLMDSKNKFLRICVNTSESFLLWQKPEHYAYYENV